MLQNVNGKDRLEWLHIDWGQGYSELDMQTGSEDVDYIQPVQNSVHQHALLNSVMNLGFRQPTLETTAAEYKKLTPPHQGSALFWSRTQDSHDQALCQQHKYESLRITHSAFHEIPGF